jgi:hypothetical protein
MLGTWRTHAEYQQFVVDALSLVKADNPQSISDFETIILKLYNLNLDSVKTDFAKRFSSTGRPSNQQPEIFRAYVLMCALKEGDIGIFRKMARSNPVLSAIIGVTPDNFPGESTMRDFVSRLWLEETPQRERVVEKKPKDKHGKEKLPPKNPGIIKELVDKALNDEIFGDGPEQLLQTLFMKTAVIPSIEQGLITNPDKLIVSADGACIESHASPYGRSTDIENVRSFADPQADWGWDSYHERWFYGYTDYCFSTYNPLLKLDLPLYIRFEKASAFDGVSLIKALAHARSLWNGFICIDSLLADSAHDNYATYDLLHQWGIKPFIALNIRGVSDPEPQKLILSKRGIPICADGYEMSNWGFDAKRYRIKYRCPLITGSVKYCSYDCNCNKTPYGKIVYVRLADNLRLLTPVPRDTDEWNETYKQRSAAERVNNRILTDYKLEQPKRYGKRKLAFFTFFNAINVHLDAQVKHCPDSIDRLLD